MSEVLRAILTDKSVLRRPAFYATSILTNAGTGANQIFSRMQASVQCKADRYFLLMGVAQFATANLGGGGGPATQGKTAPSTFQIVRAQNLQPFSASPQIKSNQNYNLNNFNSLDEYILFRPAELITLVQDVLTTNNGITAAVSTYCTLQGMEYWLPQGG